MQCVACGSEEVRRSRRRGFERLLTPLPVRAFRCRKCNYRFLAYSGPRLEDFRQPLCPRCQGTNLKRIPGDQVHVGLLRKLWRFLHVPAYYCAACRLHLFDVWWFFHREWARKQNERKNDGPPVKATTGP